MFCNYTNADKVSLHQFPCVGDAKQMDCLRSREKRWRMEARHCVTFATIILQLTVTRDWGGEVGWVFYKTSIENKLSLRFKWIQPLSNSKLLYSTWATRYTKSQPTHHKTKCKPKPNLNFTPLVLTGRMCCTNMSFNRHLSIANMHQNIYQNVFLYIFGIRNL